MSFRSAFLFAAALGVAMTAPALVAGADPYPIAVLQTLDKVTARVSTVEVPVGGAIRLGTLIVRVRQCDKRPPEETPESAAFLEIDDQRPGESGVRLFSGWMFASSPALNSLEHPVYDVWVIDCKGKTGG